MPLVVGKRFHGVLPADIRRRVSLLILMTSSMRWKSGSRCGTWQTVFMPTDQPPDGSGMKSVLQLLTTGRNSMRGPGILCVTGLSHGGGRSGIASRGTTTKRFRPRVARREDARDPSTKTTKPWCSCDLQWRAEAPSAALRSLHQSCVPLE
ncbi:uncharacterized protein [Dendrobates tinctorius]|uniref:uncharacterized protein isoform X2 n=1 Tax=Dendrobates tinctorius TaxID=92724 RepID=UPI003CC928DB